MASDINVSALSLSQNDGHMRGVTDGRMHGGGIIQVSVSLACCFFESPGLHVGWRCDLM